jgi:predicted DsbA family dithiol-disulfide isomerase
MPVLHIDIVLDVVCPWCFIGKRRLEKALALRPEIEPEFSWRPFQLNPDMPHEGMTRQDYLAAKFGGSQHAGRIYHSVAEAGGPIGIAFAFDRIRRTPATREAHRLIRHAEAQGRATALVEALFRAYFIDGSDVGERAVLTELAAKAGLDPIATARFLATDLGAAEVLAEERSARRVGINAVPCFILADQYAISGAQEPEFFLPVFDLVLNGGTVAAK